MTDTTVGHLKNGRVGLELLERNVDNETAWVLIQLTCPIRCTNPNESFRLSFVVRF